MPSSPPMLPDPNERGGGCTQHTHTLCVQSRSEVMDDRTEPPRDPHRYTEMATYLATQQPATAATTVSQLIVPTASTVTQEILTATFTSYTVQPAEYYGSHPMDERQSRTQH